MDERLKEKHGISRLMFLNSTSRYADYIEEYESEKDRLHRQFYGMGY
jgi:chitinase